MTNEEKLIADIDSLSDIDSAGLSVEMMQSMPSAEMMPLMMVNMQARITELESQQSNLIAQLKRKGVFNG